MQNLYKEDLVSLINEILHPVWIYNRETLQFLTVNKTAVTLMGYSFEEFSKMTLMDIRSPEEQLYYLENNYWRQYRSGHGSFYKIRKKNGEDLFVDIRSKDITYKKMPARIVTVYDFTDRIMHEQQLKRSEERFRISQELSLDAFTIMKAVRNDNNEIEDFEWEYINPAGTVILKLPQEVLAGAKLLEIFPASINDLFPLLKAVVESGRPHDLELCYNINGNTVWLRNMAVKLNDGVAISFHDITQRKVQHEEIERKNREIMDVVERISDTFIALDKNWNLIYANHSALMVLKSDQSILGKNFWDTFPQYKPVLYEKYAKCLANQEQLSFEFEGIATPRWYKIRVFPSPEGISVYGVDITLSKAYEEQLISSLKQKEILLKEVHHRIKNNLQIIISILNLQSYYIKDPDALEIFRQSQNRIRSMALIHEKLYKSENLSSINLQHYITDIVKYLFSTYSVNGNMIDVSVEMEHIELDSNTAISFGLILNELISNSLKYAFPPECNGKIVIGAKFQPDAILFEVSDNGKGLPKGLNYRETNSLGLQLVNTLVAQLYGKIKLLEGPGTSFRIEIPYK